MGDILGMKSLLPFKICTNVGFYIFCPGWVEPSFRLRPDPLPGGLGARLRLVCQLVAVPSFLQGSLKLRDGGVKDLTLFLEALYIYILHLTFVK